jgi:hypothetical protein
MNIEALINIKFMSGGSLDVARILNETRNIHGVKWVRLAFGPQSDAVAYVVAASQNEIAQIAVQINMIDGVAGTGTQILAEYPG